MDLRRRAHDWGLVFCVTLGVYLLAVLLAARFAPWLVRLAAGCASALPRVALGALGIDLSKAPGLLLAAWLLARLTTLAPLSLALATTVGVYALEAAVSIVLQQAPWLLHEPLVLLCRGLVAALLVAAATLLARRVRRPPRARLGSGAHGRSPPAE